MNEYTYDRLWNFTKEHANCKTELPRESKVIAILRAFQQDAAKRNEQLPLDTAMEVEEACQCINAALLYAF